MAKTKQRMDDRCHKFTDFRKKIIKFYDCNEEVVECKYCWFMTNLEGKTGWKRNQHIETVKHKKNKTTVEKRRLTIPKVINLIEKRIEEQKTLCKDMMKLIAHSAIPPNKLDGIPGKFIRKWVPKANDIPGRRHLTKQYLPVVF